MTRGRAIGLGVLACVVVGVVLAEVLTAGGGESKRQAPQLPNQVLNGPRVDLASLRGKPALVNFWASWCEPCRAEMPSLELLAAQHERNGLTILAVNYKEPLPTIKRFLDVLPFSLPILLDRDGSATGEWTPRIFPTTVLIDRSGVPRQSVLGDLEWNGPVARGLIEPLLARPKSA